ncbi:MAG TPA: hypothetical protein VMB47_18155 [Candidatus Aquilonibacter sp.]|nr:hypothetical protein [Candidatus Aquilonibacter sp.]
MDHFRTEQWADFARGTVRSMDKLLMQKHLEGGCKSCEKELSLWRRVTETARRQPNPEPSEGAVRLVKAIFATQKPRKIAKPLPMAAELLFDSMRAPALAGVRSVAGGARQLLFGLGVHRIDLRMEPELNTDQVRIIGQVLDSSNPGKFSKVTVSLHSGNKPAKVSETNDLGEFQLEGCLSDRLRLSAALPKGEEISVVLHEPATPGPAGTLDPIDPATNNRLLKKSKNRTRKKV